MLDLWRAGAAVLLVRFFYDWVGTSCAWICYPNRFVVPRGLVSVVDSFPAKPPEVVLSHLLAFLMSDLTLPLVHQRERWKLAYHPFP